MNISKEVFMRNTYILLAASSGVLFIPGIFDLILNALRNPRFFWSFNVTLFSFILWISHTVIHAIFLPPALKYLRENKDNFFCIIYAVISLKAIIVLFIILSEIGVRLFRLIT